MPREEPSTEPDIARSTDPGESDAAGGAQPLAGIALIAQVGPVAQSKRRLYWQQAALVDRQRIVSKAVLLAGTASSAGALTDRRGSGRQRCGSHGDRGRCAQIGRARKRRPDRALASDVIGDG